MTRLSRWAPAPRLSARAPGWLPPPVHGSAPDDEAAPAIAEAFARTVGSAYDQLGDYLEDADEMGAVLADRAAQFGPATQVTGRVDRIRFANADLAEVRFQICVNGATTGFPFQGTARRGEDGSWRVTPETIARVVPGGGGPPILRGRGRQNALRAAAMRSPRSEEEALPEPPQKSGAREHRVGHDVECVCGVCFAIVDAEHPKPAPMDELWDPSRPVRNARRRNRHVTVSGHVVQNALMVL